MVRGSAEDVLYRYVPALYRLGPAGGLSDGQLLERYVQSAGQASELAFEALVERHGPMVLRVCRQILGPGDDAHDAFQATFLVLVRKAGSIRKHESAASWLYGVALRVAQRARADRNRRRTREQQAAAMNAASSSTTPDAEPWPELHEEVARLPEKYRHPIVLCYFEGLSTELAAERLNCPRGTVLSRLARGRERLRARLVRRGLAPAVALLAAAETAEAVSIPPSLMSSTLALTQQFATGRLAAASSAVGAVSLAKGALSSMSLAKLKMMSAGLMAIAVLVGVPAALALTGKLDERSKTKPPANLAARVGEGELPPPPMDELPPPRDEPFSLVRDRLPAIPPSKATPAPIRPVLPPDDEQAVAATLANIDRDQAELEVLDLDVTHAKERLQKALARVADVAAAHRPVSPPERDAKADEHDPARIRWENEMKNAEGEVELWRRAYRDKSRLATKLQGQLDLIAKPGDRVDVSVLEALPGRPLSGYRIVGPTGLLSLGMYGEIQVAGLTNRQMKIKVIEHMRRFLQDAVLGLIEIDPETLKDVAIAPADSDRVSVEIDLTHTTTDSRKLSDIEEKLDGVIRELSKQRKGK